MSNLTCQFAIFEAKFGDPLIALRDTIQTAAFSISAELNLFCYPSFDEKFIRCGFITFWVCQHGLLLPFCSSS